MLKKRIIPIQLLSESRLIKTQQFSSPRDVGDPVMSSKVYSNQDADELILLNIQRHNRSISKLIETAEQINKQCFVPLTIGGGINSIENAESLFKVGADKILVNSVAYKNPNLITAISDSAGRQAVVVGIDVMKIDGKYQLFSNCGKQAEYVLLTEHLKKVLEYGAGEILIQSINQDGMMKGYDLELLDLVSNHCDLPIIIAGGAGNFQDLHDALINGASAVACGSLFNFGDNNPLRAKAFLKNLGVPLKNI